MVDELSSRLVPDTLWENAEPLIPRFATGSRSPMHTQRNITMVMRRPYSQELSALHGQDHLAESRAFLRVGRH